jgi:hypothetical protein
MTGKEDESLNRLRGAKVKLHVKISMATGENVLEDTQGILLHNSSEPRNQGAPCPGDFFDGLLRL